MAIKIPPSIKLAQLKSLAFRCGIATSGTKTLLTNRITDEIKPIHASNGTKTTTATRILSIDMGIRNLAYCVLDLPKYDVDTASYIPEVKAWQRIAVSSAPVPPQDLDSSTFLTKEAFDPQTLSAIAYALLRGTLLPYNPTYILIERQRFRSMGSPHILEWTVRVNMFESMLYAVLQTLKGENVWQGSVVPIAPGKVGPFWAVSKGLAIPESLPRPRVKQRNAKSAKLINKGAKIDLVGHLLETKQMLAFSTLEAEATAHAYVRKWRRLPGRTKGKIAPALNKKGEAVEMGKLDDLADSLLQGLAWIQWEKNKMEVLRNGVDMLDIS